MTAPLAIVGHVTVPPRALRHPFVMEATAATRVMDSDDRMERVVGTTNGGPLAGRRVELYGWGRNVGTHVDDCGWIYLVPLKLKKSVLHVGRSMVALSVGTVYRVNDFVPHGTADEGPVVCAYVGPLKTARGAAAVVRRLQAGVDALAGGRWDAPRVKEGFRVPLRREVWAIGDDNGADLIRLAEARQRRMVIARCGVDGCLRFAWKLDTHFPYFSDYNRCARHLLDEDSGDAATVLRCA